MAVVNTVSISIVIVYRSARDAVTYQVVAVLTRLMLPGHGQATTHCIAHAEAAEGKC